MVDPSEVHDLDVPPDTLIDEAYRVDRMVGRGGMGLVLLCKDVKLEREVAVKMISPDALGTRDSQELFLTEARAMAGVRHVNVVQIFSYGEHDGLPYFAMEYVPGESVAEWIDRWVIQRQPPSVDEVLGILDQVCQGLSAIHDAGIVHADVKPGNILIGPSFRVAVTDFGLVRALGERDTHELIVGTPAYISPEVVYSREPVFDPRSDVYSLTVTAYEMLTGRLPFPIEDVGQLFDVHTKRIPPRRASEARPDLPEAFDEVLMRGLSRDLDERYASTDAFRRALLQARETVLQSSQELRIVVADDDDEFLDVVQATLEFAFPGANVVCVPDGEAALRALDETPASLAIVDLDMPGLNGVELTAAIRGREQLKHMPILVVTAFGGGRDWRLLQAIGADGFLVKPLDPYGLVSMARRAIDKSAV